MDEAQYHQELQSIFNLCSLVRRLKIAAVLEAMERAEATGPILQPTLYRKALTRLAWQKKCALAALRFQHAVDEIAADPTRFHGGGKRP